jgi:hypothetical protein
VLRGEFYRLGNRLCLVTDKWIYRIGMLHRLPPPNIDRYYHMYRRQFHEEIIKGVPVETARLYVE